MKKLISLLKASMSGDMNIFKVNMKKGKKFGTIKNLCVMVFLTIAFMGIFYIYAYMIGEPLHKVGLTYIMLSLFIIIASLIVFIQGIYKSQGILFDASDNDLLFSMPIPRKNILLSRVIKLITFEYIFNFLIMIPAYIVYIILEKPTDISFYVISFIMIFLIPIIPTIIACIVGNLIKGFSSIFKNKKLMQTIFSLVFTFFFFFLSFKLDDFLNNIVSNAITINDIIEKFYYPVGLYINLIFDFETVKFALLVLINIIPAIIYILIFSRAYFKIISKSSEISTNSKYNIKKEKFKSNTQLGALVKKELKKYFSTPMYIFNTFFGLVIILVFAISCTVNFNGTISLITQSETEGANAEMIEKMIKSIFPQIYMCMLLFCISTVCITASSISLEGKSLDITKSLPISTQKLFLSKILLSDIIAIPILLISTVLLIVRTNFNLLDSLISIGICLIIPTVMAILGLIINLKYPLLNAKSDTVVIKQSASAMFSLFGNLIISAIPIMLYFILKIKIDLSIYSLIVLGGFIVLTFVLWKVLKKYGSKRFNEINA